MIITCPTCISRFQYDEKRFVGALSKNFRCPRCGLIFEFFCPPPDRVGAANVSIINASPGSGDSNDTVTDISEAHVTPPAVVEPVALPIRRSVAQGASMVSLVFLTGPKAGMAVELVSAETIIGRDNADIATMDPETSRRHARLEVMDDGTVWLSDLGSKNGTFTNGVPVTDHVQLTDRQEFTCGNSGFMMLIRL